MNEKKTARLILGIETSCDETAAAVVDEHRTIHANAIFAQLKEHAPYGGVVPEIAARAHMEHIERVVDSAMQEANVCFDDLDAIAVTTGPGLIGGVIVGVMTAKSYASVHHKPLIAVNHLEGHALTVRLTDEVAFPYLLLLVSGGHCQLLIVRGVGNYQVLGGTIDDALGEAFDKTAKLMGLGYPGGPVLEKMAKEGDASRFTFPRPLCDQPGCDFSFSGLKTAVRQRIEQLASEDGLISAQDQADVAAAFQVTVADVLKNRLTNAIEAYHDAVDAPLTVVMAGGVAANLHIREALQAMVEEQGGRFVVPPVALCTDNAAMIAWAGMERLLAGAASEPLVEPRARWPLTEVEAL